MAMPTTCAESERFSMRRRTARLSARVRAVETTLTKSGSKVSMRCGGLVEALGAGKVVEADEQGRTRLAQTGAEFGKLRRLASSADSTSRSTIWQPASAALSRISSSAVREPAKWPPKGLRRQVAMSGYLAALGEQCLQIGQRGCGLWQRIQAKFEEFESLRADLARSHISAGVPPWTATHSLGTRSRGPAGTAREGEIKRAGRCGRHTCQLTHLKRVWIRMQ